MSSFCAESVKLLQKLTIHTSDVISCDFSKYFYLATGSGDKKVIVCEWKQGFGFVETSYSPLIGHKYSVTCVRFSPNLPILATASVDGHTILWDIKNGRSVQKLVQSSNLGVRIVSFSLDGKLLVTAGEGGTLCLWSVHSQNSTLIRSINGHDDESVQGAAFSPDSILLVTGDVTGTFRIWSVEGIKDGQYAGLSTVRDAHDLGINNIEFSPLHKVFTNEEGVTIMDYTMYSCGNDHHVTEWAVSYIIGSKASGEKICTHREARRLTGHSCAVSQLRIAAKGDLLASTSIDKTVRIWQLPSGKCMKTLEGHTRYVTSAAFSVDQSLLVTGSNDKTVLVWQLVDFISLTSDFGGYFKTSDQSTNHIMDEEKENNNHRVPLLEKLVAHSSAVNSCCFGPTLFVSAGSDKKIASWKWSGTGLELVRVVEDAHRYSIHQIELSPNEELLVSASLDGTVLVWDAQSGEVKTSGFHVRSSGVRCCRFSPNSLYLAVGGDDEVLSLYDTGTYELIGDSRLDDSGITSVSFTVDSDLLAGGSSSGHIWFLMTRARHFGVMNALYDAHDLGVTTLDFATTPHTVYSGNDRQEKHELVSGGNDCLVKVWNVKAPEGTATLVWVLSGHGGTISCVRFSPGLSELIASTSSDKTCRIWDSYSGNCLHLVESQDSQLTCCAFSPDASFLATGSMDNSVLVWALPKVFQLFSTGRVNPLEQNKEMLLEWLQRNGFPPVELTGSELLETPLDQLMELFKIDDEVKREELVNIIKSLRMEPPHEFICPITHHIMRDPVLAQDGYTYERSAIGDWFRTGGSMKRSPMTNEALRDTNLEENEELKSRIQAYLKERK